MRSTFQSGVADYILKPKLDMQHLLTVLKLTAKRIPALQTGQGGGERSLTMERLLDSFMNGFESSFRVEEVKQFFPHAHFRLVGSNDRGVAERLTELPQSVQVLLPQPQERTAHAWLINGNETAMSAALQMVKNRTSANGGAVAVSPVFSRLEELSSVYRDSLLKLLQYAFYLPDLMFWFLKSCRSRDPLHNLSY